MGIYYISNNPQIRNRSHKPTQRSKKKRHFIKRGRNAAKIGTKTHNMPTRLFQYDRHIEITNPGGLYVTFTQLPQSMCGHSVPLVATNLTALSY